MIRKNPIVNELVVFRKRKDLSLGLARKNVAEKLSVLTEDGNELDLDMKRVVLSTGIKCENELTLSEKKLRLRTIRKQLDDRQATVDLKTLWECVYESTNLLTLEQMIDIYFGESNRDNIRDDEVLLLFWALEKDDIYFSNNDGGYTPRTAGEVEDTVQRKESEKKKRVERELAVKWARAVIKGVDEEGAEAKFVERYLELIKGYVVYLDRYERSADAKSFLSEIGIRSIDDAVEFLIKTGKWNEDEDPLIERLGLKSDFSERIAEEVSAIINRDAGFEGREDLTSVETFTIDDEGTLDIDDAISIQRVSEGFIVGVHISDVASYVLRWSQLDEEAKSRGETIYLPEGNIHMFPLNLVRTKFSLTEGSPKKAISLLVLFDENLKIKHYRFTKSKIHVQRNLSYKNAEESLSGYELGSKLIDIAFNLRKRRVESGAFILELPDLKIKLNNNGNIEIRKNYMNTTAHRVVTEFMILMNWLAARFFKINDIPAIFRSQPDPISKEARELDEEDPLFPLRAVRFLRPSRIGNSPEPHMLLGLDVYVQITSPIRRYLDLVSQRQLCSFLDGSGLYYTIEELESIFHYVEFGLREKKIVEKSREKYWVFKHIRNLQGEDIKGIISSLTGSGASVYLPDYLLEVPISLNSETVLNEGEQLKLTVVKADPIRKQVYLLPKTG
ncbi:MAG: ribonuclease catalytic domain-containing protein [Thermodesulfobacteriota bacterium]